jgi:hypothetical protein
LATLLEYISYMHTHTYVKYEIYYIIYICIYYEYQTCQAVCWGKIKQITPVDVAKIDRKQSFCLHIVRLHGM